MEQRIVALETELNEVKANQSLGSKELAFLNGTSVNSISNLAERVSTLEFNELLREQKWVVLDPTSKSYQRIDTDLMPILVVVKDVSPYLDGYKVKLQIGNPYGMNFNGFHVSCKWGISAKYSNGVITNLAEFKLSQKSKDMDQTEVLYSGWWNDVELNVIPASSEEIRNLRISITPNQITLKDKNQKP